MRQSFCTRFLHFITGVDSGDAVFPLYRRGYKRRFAWIKAGRIEPDAFYAWSEKAREKKAECETGKISFEEFSKQLRNS